jgi:hypothetical protein
MQDCLLLKFSPVGGSADYTSASRVVNDAGGVGSSRSSGLGSKRAINARRQESD